MTRWVQANTELYCCPSADTSCRKLPHQCTSEAAQLH
jgi:hypothetical protein